MSSVRERMEGTSNNSPNTAVTTDHSASAWGTLSVTQRIENQRQVAYLLACSCGAKGQRVSQMELSSGTVPICRLCNGTGTAPGDAPRRAGTAEQRMKQDITMSPRQRAEMAARKAEQEAIEKEGQ